MEIDSARVEHMMGRRINHISAEDMRDSNFEEYLQSRIRGSKNALTRKFNSSRIGRIIYGAEYDSFREWNCSPLKLTGVDMESFKRNGQLEESMTTLTETLKKVEQTEGRGTVQRYGWDVPFKQPDISDPSYGADGRAVDVSKKRFNQIDFQNTTIGDYISGRVIAAQSWLGKGFEFVMVPVRATRFVCAKYFRRDSQTSSSA